MRARPTGAYAPAMIRSGKAIISAAAARLLVGACGSSSSKASTGGGGLQNTPGGSTHSGGSSGGSSSGNSSLSDLIAKGKTADIKLPYKISGSAATGGTSITLIQRGNDSVDSSATPRSTTAAARDHLHWHGLECNVHLGPSAGDTGDWPEPVHHLRHAAAEQGAGPVSGS